MKQLKDITTAKIYADEEVLRNAPRHTHIRELEFFTLDRYVSNDELEKEYRSRGLEPDDIYSLAIWDEANKDREEKNMWQPSGRTPTASGVTRPSTGGSASASSTSTATTMAGTTTGPSSASPFARTLRNRMLRPLNLVPWSLCPKSKNS